jgi:arylsulfatase I/J
VGLTGGGLQFVGDSDGGAGSALQFGVAGEVEPRVTIGTDGSLNYRSNETAATITTVETVQSNTTSWDPPSLAPGAAARYTVLLRGSRRGDVAAASLSSIDDEFVQLSAIARDGVVAVVLRNAEGGDSGRPVDIAVGKLRVVVTAFGSAQPVQKTDNSGPSTHPVLTTTELKTDDGATIARGVPGNDARLLGLLHEISDCVVSLNVGTGTAHAHVPPVSHSASSNVSAFGAEVVVVFASPVLATISMEARCCTGANPFPKGSVKTDDDAPSSSVLLTPIDDVQKAIDFHPAGTTFLFAPGRYYKQGNWVNIPGRGKVWYGLSITKNNTVLQAQHRRTAIFSGAIILNSSASMAASPGIFTADIAGYTDNSTWPKTTGYGICHAGWEACNYRQDVFFNDKVIRRVPTRGNVTARGLVHEPRWYLDYGQHVAIMNFDPRGGVLEISYQDTFLAASGTANVTVRGLVIEKIANHAQSNTCEGATTIDDCEVRWAHGGGAMARYVTGSWIHDIGQLGSGATSLLADNLVERCNYANYSYSWEAGGVKVFSNKQIHDEYGPLVIRNNTVKDNFGPGLWSDGGGWNISYLNNTVIDNALAGIFHEISFNATISGNKASGNCWWYSPKVQNLVDNPCPWCGYCGQITLSTSQNVVVESNDVLVEPNAVGNYAAIAMYQDARGVDQHTNLTYQLRNNTVKTNRIHFSDGAHARSGVVEFDNATQWKTAAINFNSNIYTSDSSADESAAVFWWCAGAPVQGGRAPCHSVNFTYFQSQYQQELDGRWETATRSPLRSPLKSDDQSNKVFFLDNSSPAARRARPHLVHVVVDDLGWHNTALSNPEVLTPNIVALAAEGISLTRHYTYRYCSPTRCSLLSGRYPHHVSEANFQNNYVGGFIHANMTIIAAKLRAVGYRTHHTGKWHAGMSSHDLVPTGRGFSTSLGYLAGAEDHLTQRGSSEACDGSHPVDLLRDGRPALGLNGTTFGGNLWSARAQQVVAEHQLPAPMYLYYAFQDCHSPQEAPEAFTNLYPASTPPFRPDRCSSDLQLVAPSKWPRDCGDSTRRVYNAMITFADSALGNLTGALRKRGMWENTLLVWSSDNGGPSGSSSNSANNWPLRGAKYSDFEGGVRTRALVSGGFIPLHRRGASLGGINGFIHVTDWYATFCFLGGAPLHDSPAAAMGLPQPDSLNMWPVLTGTSAVSPRTEVPLSVGGEGAKSGSEGGLIVPPYKILLGLQTPQGYTPTEYPSRTQVLPTYPSAGATLDCGATGCLFNVIDDPKETLDLADSLPTRLVEIRTRFQQIAASKYQTPGVTPPCESYSKEVSSNGGFWAPFSSTLPYPVTPRAVAAGK